MVITHADIKESNDLCSNRMSADPALEVVGVGKAPKLRDGSASSALRKQKRGGLKEAMPTGAIQHIRINIVSLPRL